jgi:aspartate/methionine/tyrosine aminotransferase
MKIKEFKLERFFAEHEFNAPYLLCSSDCESFTVEELLSLYKKAEEEFKKLRLGYTESSGSPALREEISRLYKHIKPEEIIVFAGAQEGIFIFMNVLMEKGDHVIVQWPCYQSLFEIAHSIGCDVTEWQMDGRNNWEIDISFLKKHIRKNTKAIVINSPHNPTGYVIPEEKFNEIIQIAGENDTYIFSDEVYKFLEYDEKDRFLSLCDAYDKGVSLGVMSKSFGLAGLRTGWISSKDNSLLKNMAAFKDFTSICNSAPGEFLSIIGLKHKDILLKRNLQIIKDNLILLDTFFNRYSNLFDWVRPKAGAIAFPEIKFDKNVEDFSMDLLRKKGVLLLPGTKYDFGDKHFRIGFGRKNMPEALKKVEEYISEYLKGE